MERNKKKEYIQDAIIDGIFSLLLEKNWASLSSNEICEEAGVSKRTLYAYFHSQDEMYLELVKRSFERMNVAMGDAMTQKVCAFDKIIYLGEAYIKFMLENPREGALILGFDEKRYENQYEKQVNEIHLIANQYELMHLFRELNLNTTVFDGNLAVFLWAHIQGIAQLLHSKGKWMEEYYGVSIEDIIEGQMKLTRQMLGGLK
ncbi:MAG: TetR/AcrR family transcriptional regulator [Anaerotignum propionicum]|uniref:TetR/AcrR family transcriptional regulator n=1 Tax=Anaerotignum propionicum TaxID=28446 RepID=UPI002B213DEC|nr:TetR/AcrR family transcriptional regulator [Anaerotignum propionicum]MEA5056044.1 TetR/AcrR family transcriptional regulator [Anaerotignum propionicum]